MRYSLDFGRSGVTRKLALSQMYYYVQARNSSAIHRLKVGCSNTQATEREARGAEAENVRSPRLTP
jgi:hypothetical protein